MTKPEALNNDTHKIVRERQLRHAEAIKQILRKLGVDGDKLIPPDKLKTALEENNAGGLPTRVVVRFREPDDTRSGIMNYTAPIDLKFGRETTETEDNEPIALFLIDTNLRDQMLSTPAIGPEGLETVMRCLHNLLNFSNHDFIVHELGLMYNTTNLEKALSAIIQYDHSVKAGNKSPDIERVAAVVYRILFHRALEQSQLLHRFTLLQLKTIAKIIKRLPTDQRKSWLQVLKYAAYTLFNPNSPEMLDLRANFSDADSAALEPGDWARIVHNDEFTLKDGRKISAEDLMAAVFPISRNLSEEEIIKLIEAKAK